MLQEVLEQHKSAWAAAWGEELARWDRAESEPGTNRALMCMGLLPKALLRKPTRGDGAGRREVAKRFFYINQVGLGNLITFLHKDSE